LAKQIITLYHAVQKLITKDQHALGTGHGGSLEFSGVLSEKHDVEWFIRADVVDSVSRLLAGVKLSFES